MLLLFITLLLVFYYIFSQRQYFASKIPKVKIATQTNNSFRPQVDHFKIPRAGDYYIYLETGDPIGNRGFTIFLYEDITDIKEFLKENNFLQKNLLKGVTINYYIRPAELSDYNRIFQDKSIKQEYRNCLKIQAGMEEIGKIGNCGHILGELSEEN